MENGPYHDLPTPTTDDVVHWGNVQMALQHHAPLGWVKVMLKVIVKVMVMMTTVMMMAMACNGEMVMIVGTYIYKTMIYQSLSRDGNGK